MLTLMLISVLAMLIHGQHNIENRVGPQSFFGRCRRTPPGVGTSKDAGTNGFTIKISGNPNKYQPQELYTVTLQGFETPTTTKKFTGFILVAESKESESDISSRPDVGIFQLSEDGLSKFSEDCPNAIVHTSLIHKSEIQVKWKAPPAESGCVVFKATIQDSKEKWYSEAGSLVRELCEEEENQDEQPEIVEECYACDEAKYEIAFEGLWSRHTHPNKFPTNEWLTHFPEIIGASHSAAFRMWEYGGMASAGVKQLATKGLTKKLESELKIESNKIRTIIKARGLQHPNINGKTFAVFRVDKVHHLMSFLTKLGPSPDWIVGVSALELCLKNGSWVNEKIMNLYPWDAGVDSGLTYINSKIPTVPQEKIRRITSSSPNSEDYPFFDPSGAPMKPVAKLTVTKQRVYEKTCIVDNTRPPPSTTFSTTDVPMECQVTAWSEFTPCSSTCGPGLQIRTRRFYDTQKAMEAGCSIPLVENVQCDVSCGNTTCRTSEWSACSVTCGKGFRTRSRKYMDPRVRKACSLELMEKETCMGMKPFCEGPKEPDPKCNVTQWSEWSPCTVTCGKGLKMRTRLYLNDAATLSTCNVELMQKLLCTVDKPDCIPSGPEVEKICKLTMEVGPCRGYFPRWYYDVNRTRCMQFIYGGCRGNRNNFDRYIDCRRTCEVMLQGTNYGTAPQTALTYLLMEPTLPSDHTDQTVIDCVVTSWSEWSSCSHTCGNGRKERRRTIKFDPENGRKSCPTKLIQRRKCKDNPACPE